MLTFFFILGLTGCATLRRKFVRKKKKEEQKPTVILALKDYDKLINYQDLYKKHFLLWQYWQEELISALGQNFKKQRECIDQALENLSALEKYITPDKKSTLDTYLARLDKIRKRLYGRSLNSIEKDRIKRELEKIKRLVDKGYRYSKIKSYIVIPTPKQK